jgi:hypothetical protein
VHQLETPESSVHRAPVTSLICLLTQHPFSSGSEPTTLENFFRTVRNYALSSIPKPTTPPAPPSASCPGSVAGSFMLSALLSVSPPLLAYSSP